VIHYFSELREHNYFFVIICQYLINFVKYIADFGTWNILEIIVDDKLVLLFKDPIIGLRELLAAHGTWNHS
jgi:hypothetical protein